VQRHSETDIVILKQRFGPAAEHQQVSSTELIGQILRVHYIPRAMSEVPAQRHSVQKLSRRLLLDRNTVKGDIQLRACNHRKLLKHRSPLQPGSLPLPTGKLLQRQHLH
jgi:hypothetical protein